MTHQTHNTINSVLVVLTDEQRLGVADALERAQSENTRKNYRCQLRGFQFLFDWEDYSPRPEA